MLDFSTNPLTLTPGSYSQLVADTAGTDSVDNDPVLAGADHAQILADQMGTEIPGSTDALTALSAVRSLIPNNPGLQNAAQLAAAMRAAGGHLNDYETIVAPVVNPSQPGAPNPTPPSAGSSNPGGPCPTDPSAITLRGLTVGDPPSLYELDSQRGTAPSLDQIVLSLACGDSSIFGWKRVSKFEATGPSGAIFLVTYNVQVTPSAPGYFNAVLKEVDRTSGAVSFYYVNVTISAKA
jgi:hypothetical protein